MAAAAAARGRPRAAPGRLLPAAMPRRPATHPMRPPPMRRSVTEAKAKAAHEFKEYSHCLDITGCV
jgi:hypothetical protein